MKPKHLLASGLSLATTTSAFDCTESTFEVILPPEATVSFARYVSADSVFEVPAGNIAYPTSPVLLRSVCAVQINVTSSPTSEFSFGLFLPEGWNERFLAVGNGGFAGGVNWLDMAAGLGYGFATMSTDTGHTPISSDGSWALNKESLTDWGYRAMHGSVVLAKQVVESYYAHKPRYSYYSGCSTGGRQGLKEVEMFPEDFDGVLAGAPAWWTSHLQTWTVKAGLDNLPTTSASHIPPTLFPAIGAEVLRQCDGQDGFVDSIVSDPRGCKFNADALLCPSDVVNQTEAGCLTRPQIETLHRIFSDYVEDEKLVFPRLEPGSEAQWVPLLGGSEPNNLGIDYVRYFLLNDPNWDFYDFNYDIVQEADRVQPGNASATDFDLSPFQAKGGKLLHYHGLADGLIPTGSSEVFYREVLKTLKSKGIELDSWYRFFLVPGMQHCAGTPSNVNAPWYFAGGNQAGDLGRPGSVSGVPGFSDPEHDVLLALMRWTEEDTAPEKIIATKWFNDSLQDQVLRQRPLCPFPQRAKYTGQGDPNDAATWSCVEVGPPNHW